MAFLQTLVLSIVLQTAPAATTVVEYRDQRVTLTADVWAKLPKQEVKADDHGTPAVFEGVLLRRILALVSAPAGSDLKGQALRLIVRIEAADGYQAVFALAELDPLFRDRAILLADRRDGKPLGDNAKPFQVVVPDEARGARWVRMVTRIAVVEVR